MRASVAGKSLGVGFALAPVGTLTGLVADSVVLVHGSSSCGLC
jgi:hypothetical protein